MNIMRDVADALRRLHHWRHENSGGFYDKLFDAISHADEQNRDRLHKVFPHEVDVFDAYLKYGDKYFSTLGDV
jgi:hypothetical protein